jgi:uncharacterized membrane protein (Fun14 family)
LVFSASGGFLFGAVAGYAIKKVMKIAAIVLGLFVVGLSYLSYKGWINVKWLEMENATKATLTNDHYWFGLSSYSSSLSTSQDL